MINTRELVDKLINQTITAIDNGNLTTPEIIDAMAVAIVKNIDVTFSAATVLAAHVVSIANDSKIL